MAVVTQQGLDALKQFFVGDDVIQALTLDVVMANVRDRPEPDFMSFTPSFHERFVPHPMEVDTATCNWAIAKSVFAGVATVANMGGLGARILLWNRVPVRMYRALETTYTEISQIIETLPPVPTVEKVADAFLGILKVINGANLLGHVIYALLDELSWWDWLLFAISVCLFFVSFFASGGAAMVLAIVSVLTSVAALTTAIVGAVSACQQG